MRLRQIEVFHAIYSSGSMTNAAALLNVSQPSISKVLSHAEQQLGFALFERSKGRLVPTPEADQLFKHVTRVYQDVDRLRHIARNLRSADVGRVRIACTPAFGVELMPLAVASFLADNPDVVFDIETLHMQEIDSALLESRIDVGIAFDPVPSPGIEVRTLATSRFVVLAPLDSAFDTRKPVSIEDLAGHRFIGLNNRGPLGQLLSTKLAATDIALDTVAWTETYHVAKALVACGAGLSIADAITARSAPLDRIKIIALEPALEFNVCAMHNGAAPLSLLTTSFVAHLQAALVDFLDDGLYDTKTGTAL